MSDLSKDSVKKSRKDENPVEVTDEEDSSRVKKKMSLPKGHPRVPL